MAYAFRAPQRIELLLIQVLSSSGQFFGREAKIAYRLHYCAVASSLESYPCTLDEAVRWNLFFKLFLAHLKVVILRMGSFFEIV